MQVGEVVGGGIVGRKIRNGYSLAHLRRYPSPKPSLFSFSKISRESKVRYQLCDLRPVPPPFRALSGKVIETEFLEPPPCSPAPAPSLPAPFVRGREGQPCSVVLGRKGEKDREEQGAEREKLALGRARCMQRHRREGQL